MYAIIRTGGKQYRVSEGDTLSVEKLPAGVGEQITFPDVLLLGTDTETKLGTPVVPGVVVAAEVIEVGKGRKVIAYKFKPRKNYRRKLGHRQMFTRVRIKTITVG